jgi:hypothetical protein
MFMELLSNIKWYHITIVCLICILVFLIFTRNNCGTNVCKNAPIKSEGFSSQQQEQESKQETNQIKDTATAEIILYYAMWCGHSRSFLPEWEKFEAYAKNNFPNLRVSRVRCEDGNEATCMQKGVEGYPTVILYPMGGSEKMFDGTRSSDSLIKFIQQNVGK